MKILFISSLNTSVSVGLNWSVPASIRAIEKKASCLWINITNVTMEHWKYTQCFHNLNEFGNKLTLPILPIEFQKPDVVVFEGFYKLPHPLFAQELRRYKIPYIIVPRCSLTKQALNNHAKWKKLIAHWLVFDKFVNKAAAIQYLTKDEYRDSGTKWNKNHFILSNGFSTPLRRKETFHTNIIKAIFIGRLEIYQKGIDVLLDACNALKEELRSAGFSLQLYGPEKYHYHQINQIIKDKGLDDFISLEGETSGIHKENALLDSDVFVLTSRFEGHPMGLIEALAYGVPAIVTPGTNMSKEICESNAGWVCNDVTVDEIVKMLRQLLAERNQLSIKSKNAMKLAKQYDWDILADKFCNEVTMILKK